MTNLTGILGENAFEGAGTPFAAGGPAMPPMFPKGTALRIFTGNMADPDEVATAESILTTSMRCQGYLRKAGDIAVIEKQGTFDKVGEYHLYLYYAELPAGWSPTSTADKGVNNA